MGIIENHAMRLTAIEARCHALEHDRAKGVQSQIADLQERVKTLENERSQEVRYAPVDDRRDKERPHKPEPELAPQWVCEKAKECTVCAPAHRRPHGHRPNCDIRCDAGGRCQPIPDVEEMASRDMSTPQGA